MTVPRGSAVLGAVVVGLACNACDPTPSELADRGWRAHAAVIGAGERAATCADAGAAMLRTFDARRQAFIDAIELEHDRERMTEAAPYLEANRQRYADLATRMIALSDRCADEPTVVAAFRQMETPQ
ncbi:MAG: hypothetical protein AB7R00_15130 [Kofleriaceae bacterium]